MGFFSKIIDKVTPQGFIDDITGETGSDAAKESAKAIGQYADQAREEITAGAAEQMALLQPFAEFGDLGRLQAAIRGTDASGTLKADPYGINYLSNNPLFKAAVDNAGDQLKFSQAAQGKLQSGGTIDQLFKNYLAIGDQMYGNYLNRLDTTKMNNINRELIPVNIAQQAAGAQVGVLGARDANLSNLLLAKGNSQAAGIVGAANAEMAGTNNLINLGSQLAGFALNGGFAGRGGGGGGYTYNGGFNPIYGNLGGIGLD